MITQKQRVAVVGAGAAGSSFAERLMELSGSAEIIMFDSDPHQPYDRPKLSRLLTGAWSAADLHARSEELLSRVGLRVEPNAITGLNPEKRVLHAAGREISYDKVVLAPRRRSVPGMWDDIFNVFRVHSFADVSALLPHLDGAPGIVVVGGGLLGLETAAALRTGGHDVILAAGDAPPLAQSVGAEVGEILRTLHVAHGVDVEASRLSQIDAKTGAAFLTNGRIIEGHVVVLCTGVAPATDWLAGSGVDLDGQGAIVTDAYLRTSAEGVWACGEAVSWPSRQFGRSVRVEHWANAVAQGRWLAEGLAMEKDGAFDELPYFYSSQFGISLQGSGCLDLSDVEVDVERADTSPAFTARYYRSGQLSGVLSLGQPRAFLKARVELAQQLSSKPEVEIV